MTPTFVHFVSLSAPQGGWPCLGRPGAAAFMTPTFAHFVSLSAPRGGRCACGPAKPVPRPLLKWEARSGVCFPWFAAPEFYFSQLDS